MSHVDCIVLHSSWAIRISCHAGRMVYHRSRPSALGCLRHYADQRCIITSVAEQVGLTLIIFVVVYCVVFGVGIFYMLRLMHRGPEFIHSRPHHESDSDVVQASRRPLSSIRERIEEVPEHPDQEDKND
jgi:Cytochrome bd-type quinol oxidase, subunit 1